MRHWIAGWKAPHVRGFTCALLVAWGASAAMSGPSTNGIAPNRLPGDAARAMLDAERDPYWLNARESITRSVLSILAQDTEETRRGIRHDKLLCGSTTRKWVALTFDDGPHPAYTPRILEILKQYGVKATFFVVGEMAEKHPELIRQEIAAGHSVGNHTYHHVNLRRIPQPYVAAEIKACGEVLRGITGKAPHLFRPPGGQYNDDVAEATRALGYQMILWTDDPGDYASPGQSVITQRTLSSISNGGIILLHDGISQTIEVLPGILQSLKDRGYELVLIDQMLPPRTSPAARRVRGVERA